MDCGATDFSCRVFVWLREAGIDLAQFYALLSYAWLSAWEGLRALGEFLLAHAEKLFGLAGFSFGVWRWWYTRERILHKRLQEYLAEQDERLSEARSYVLEALFRPGRTPQFAEPLFAVRPLRRVLRRHRWDSLLWLGRVEEGAEQNLDKAIRDIERRIETAVTALTSLRAQMASAYLLQGAIASARASRRRNGPQQIDLDDRALIQFRTVLQVHDYERDVQAKEYEAHQLRKLGHIAEADNAYEQLEGFSAWVQDDRTRNLTLARARRYRAQIAQGRAIAARSNRLQPTSGSQIANAFMNGEVGALPLRAMHAPFRAWDAVEQGEMHYVSAFVCYHLGAVVQQPIQLSHAESMFRQVLNQTPSRWFMRSSAKRLRAAAQAGLDRVHGAQFNGTYDTDWLLPPSHDSQQPTTAVGNPGGN